MTPLASHRIGVSRASYDAYPARRRVRSPGGRVVTIALWTMASSAIVLGIATKSIATILPGLFAWIPAMAAVNVVGGGLNAMRTEELDEREVRQRERAFALAHRAISLALLTVLAASAALVESLTKATFIATLAGLVLLHIASPSLILAVQSRLPEPGDPNG